jgi:phage terminase large subunit GpA-like protein
VKSKRVTCRPTWWPCEYPAAIVGRSHVYRMGAERLRLKKPKRRPVSEWSERYRVLSQSSRPGPWRNSTARYLVGIMDAIDHPSVETVVFCKPPQSGGSEAVHNFVGSRIDMDPGEVLYIYPDDHTASLNSKDRIQPMLTSSPRLSSYMTGTDDDVSTRRIKLKHMVIYLASAQSASQLANKPCKYVIFDETDKYPTELKGEADPVSLGRKRTTTYAHSRKMIELSTPTTERGQIWTSLRTAQVVFHYWCKCPHCGELQTMLFSGIKWDGGGSADPEEVEAYGLAWYECRHCSRPWTDEDRDDAVRRGEWRACSGGQDVFKEHDAAMGDNRGMRLFAALDRVQPKKIGFHIPAWVSPFVSLSECAAAFLKGQKDKSKLKDFSNAFEAVPWREMYQSRAEDSIVALQDELDEGDVPDWADVLLLGADTQDNGFWYEIRAFQRGPELRSHGIRRGFVESLAALEEVALNTVYLKPDGTEVPLRAGIIDAMGHRTVEVYDWCRKVKIIQPLKGERKMDNLFAQTMIDKMPGSGRKIPGGLPLHRIDTNHFKNLLAAKLQISVADPGAWTFSRGLDATHARHYVAEDVDPKTGYWACPQGRANHLWDCSVYVLALAYILRLRLYRKTNPADQRGEDDHKLPIVRRRAKYQIMR